MRGKRADLITLGKYKEFYKDDNLPSLFDNISDTPHQQKDRVIKVMESAIVSAAAPAILTDVISGERINEELTFKVIDKYGSRSDLLYYYKKYNLKLPDDFVRWCVENGENISG